MSRSQKDSGTFIAGVVLLASYGYFYYAYKDQSDPLSLVKIERSIAGFPSDLTLETEPYKASPEARAGAVVYEQYCIGCHGAEVDGQGPASSWLKPKPRNFQTGRFKFVSSIPQTLPRHEDLYKTITDGLPGSSMPSFRLLSEGERRNLVEYVLHLTRNARYWRVTKALVTEALEDADEDDPFTAEILAEVLEDNVDITTIAEAKALFPDSLETDLSFESLSSGHRKFQTYCHSCHGRDGKGLPMLGTDGKPQPDEFGEPSIPRDLTKGIYRHGTSSLDIWYRIKRGLDGAIMPAASGWTSDEAWNVSHYTQLLFDPALQARFPPAKVHAQSEVETLPIAIEALEKTAPAEAEGPVAKQTHAAKVQELKDRLAAARALLEEGDD